MKAVENIIDVVEQLEFTSWNTGKIITVSPDESNPDIVFVSTPIGWFICDHITREHSKYMDILNLNDTNSNTIGGLFITKEVK